MKHLYFKHENGEMNLVKKDVGYMTDDDLWIPIYLDIRRRNPDFVVHNKKVYTDPIGRRWYEVGSRHEEKYVVF